MLSESMKSVEEFVEHLSYLSRLADDLPKLEKEYDIICHLFSIAFDYGCKFTAEEKALYQTLSPSFLQLKVCLLKGSLLQYDFRLPPNYDILCSEIFVRFIYYRRYFCKTLILIDLSQ